MGLFKNQFLNVVEWEEYRDDILFWKWENREIKKDSKLIIRPGQDAIFMFNGKIEGIFTDDGDYDIESQIIPFLSTLKGFKFGFNSGMRAEVIFVNTKEFTMKWGTKNPIRVPAPEFPGGIPIRSNGTFAFKINDYPMFIENIAGVKKQYSITEVRERVVSMLDGLLMRWISKAGKNMFDLMANSLEIQNGIKEDLDMDFIRIGLTVTDFRINEFSYPENIQKRADQAVEHSMIGDMNRFQQVSMVDAMTGANGNQTAANMANNMMGMQMGMMMGQQMMNNMQNNQSQQMQQPQQTQQPQQPQQSSGDGTIPKFCPNCGTPTNGMKFCGKCGNKLG